MNLRKNIFRIVTVIYDVVALFCCCVITSGLIYKFTPIGVNEGSIGIIGGADFPTAIFMLQTGAIFSYLLHITFALLNIAIPVLLTIAAFKAQAKRRLNIWLIVLLSIGLVLFFVISKTTYVITVYNVLAYEIEVYTVIATIIYYLASLLAILINAFSLIKRKA